MQQFLEDQTTHKLHVYAPEPRSIMASPTKKMQTASPIKPMMV